MSKRPQKAVIVSANALLDGVVVYYAGAAGWSPHLAEARVAATEEEIEALNAVRAAAEASGAVVEPEVLPVDTDAAGNIVPSHYREKIRALGPTVRTDLGPQAQGEHSHVSL
jgi:hypothetical protein